MEPPIENTTPQPDAIGRFPSLVLPLILSLACLLVGLFFLRPVLGDPDSYREALSAIQYIEEGTYGSYWDHALSMYFFVFGTLMAAALGWNQITGLNVVAALMASLSVWPFYHLVRRLVNWQTAAFASAALISSPLLIRVSVYLTHEVVGYAFALWSVYLFELAVSKKKKSFALGFGLAFAATWAARPNGAVFIGLPILVLLIWRTTRSDFGHLRTLLSYAFLGFVLVLLLIYRPELISQFITRSDVLFSSQYFFGQYPSTTPIAIRALTPVLVVLTFVAIAVLLLLKKWPFVLFGAIWIFPVYVFYLGMGCRHKYFVVLLAPCLFLLFTAANSIDERVMIKKRRHLHAIKILVLLLLLAGSLAPNVSDIFRLRNSRDFEIIGRKIGETVDGNLLLGTSEIPLVAYYSKENPPQSLYFLITHRPDSVKASIEHIRLAQHHLEMGSPVFATDIVIDHLKLPGFDLAIEPVWEYKSMRLFRITRLDISGPGAFGYIDE
jgi:4-amino-4-deoxy-L-arabinose transferase-like glycosyltransferase